MNAYHFHTMIFKSKTESTNWGPSVVLNIYKCYEMDVREKVIVSRPIIESIVGKKIYVFMLNQDKYYLKIFRNRKIMSKA